MRSPLRTLTILLVLFSSVCSMEPAFGQSRGGSQDERGDRRGGDEDRRARFLRSMDRNGDGVLSKDEVSDRMRGFLDRMAERAGVKPGGDLKIADLLSRRDRDRDSNRSKNALAFGEEADDRKAPGFGADSSSSGSAVTSYVPATGEEIESAKETADDLMERYDGNRSRVLERDEWKQISGTPANADTNRDGKITRTELVNRLIVMRRSRREEKLREESRAAKASRENPRERSAGNDDDRRSYRFTTPVDRIPEAARKWISGKDKNGDGQVAMHEYSSSWTDSRVREFSRYDGNSDGVITPEEYLAKK